MSEKMLSRVFYGAAAAVILIFIGISSWYIESPGLYYDEVLFVNAALQQPQGDTYIYKTWFGIPVMVMPYIGALKSLIYRPIFALCGVSVAAIRLPVIFISAGTLWLGFLLSRGLFKGHPHVFPLLFVMVMATDPAFIINSRLDYGPVVLMLFFKMLSLYLFFRMIQEKSVPRLAGLLICLLAGLYDKLNFIWHIIGLGMAAAAIFYQELAGIVRRNPFKVMACMAGFGGILVWAGFHTILPLLNSPSMIPARSLYEKLKFVEVLYLITMNGIAFYLFLFNALPETVTLANTLLSFSGAGLLAYLWIHQQNHLTLKCDPWVIRLASFFLFSGLLITAQIALTRQAGGQHHFMILYPYHHLLMFSVLYGWTRMIPLGRRWIAWGVVIVITGMLIHSQTAMMKNYFSGFKEEKGFDARWDTRIYDLAGDLNTMDADAVLSTDWGLHNQISALADEGRRGRYHDCWQIFNVPLPDTIKQWMYETRFKGKTTCIITHGQDFLIMKNTRKHFFDFADQYELNMELIQQYKNSQGQILYEIYCSTELRNSME
jgi:hypothetical protein